MAKKMAVSPQPIGALGGDAYWKSSRRELVIVRGRYLITIQLQPDSGDQPAAKILAAKVSGGCLQTSPSWTIPSKSELLRRNAPARRPRASSRQSAQLELNPGDDVGG
jgi:hypothetical protein